MKGLIRLLVLCLVAMPLVATADWTIKDLRQKNRSTLAFTDTTQPSIVRTAACENVTVWLAEADGAEVQFYRCGTSIYDADSCDKLLNDTDGDGINNDVTWNGDIMRSGREDVRADFLQILITVAPTTSGLAVLECK